MQPGLELFQGRGMHSFLGQSVPMPHHSHYEKFLSNIQSKSTLFQIKTIVPTSPGEKPFSIFLISPFKYWKVTVWSFQIILISRLHFLIMKKLWSVSRSLNLPVLLGEMYMDPVLNWSAFSLAIDRSLGVVGTGVVWFGEGESNSNLHHY